MGQLAVIERPQTPAVPTFSMADLERVATAIAKGGLFGSNDPYAVLTLCMLAQAEGQHPAVVFRDYDLIQGKPSKKAKAMLADFLAAGGKVEWHRLDDEVAEATFSHPAGGSATINWNMARAVKAGLGGKDMWKKYPRQMLRSRVVSEGVSTVFPGATSGMYVPEEVMDFAPDPRPATPATPEPKRARDMKALPAADAGRAKAEQWVAAYDGEDTPANDRALAKLKRDHPDLYEQAINATVSGPAAVAPDVTGPLNNAGDAAAPAEGRDETQMGEAVTLADALAEVDACELVADINARTAALLPLLSDEDADVLRTRAMERVAERKASR